MNQKPHAEQLTENYHAALDGQYLNGDRSKPVVVAGLIEQQEKQWAEEYFYGLVQIRQASEAQKAEADILEAKARQHPSAHLSNSELQAAALRRPFIEKDAEVLDSPTLIENARQAAMKGDKASAFAYLEVLPDASNIKEQQAIDNVRETLKQTLIPPNLRNAAQRANQMRLEAEIERVAAKSALHDLSGKSAGTFNPFTR